MPFDMESAEYLTGMGLGDRARAAVEAGEGEWDADVSSIEFRTAQAEFKRRLEGARAVC